MAFHDRRDKNAIHKYGSSELAVGLTQAQCQEIWADLTAPDGGWVAGWYSLGYLEGGEMGSEVTSEDIRDEAGDHVKVIRTRDEIAIGNGAMQTDDYSMRLLDWLQKNTAPMRYPLPAGVDGDGDPVHQLWYGPHGKIDDDGWKMTVQEEGTRSRPFTARWVKRGSGPAYGYLTVSMATADQANWPAALAPYKDEAFAPA